MIFYRPDQIFIEEAVRDCQLTRTVLGKLPGVEVFHVRDSRELRRSPRRRELPIPTGKRSLLIAKHQGTFFKPCPASQVQGGRRNVCCNYFVVNLASNCHMECSYCYLQTHLNFPLMVVYANIEDLLEELSGLLRENKQNLYRIGTGELADSLALDPLTESSRPLVEFFAQQSNAVLEFKTKSNCVEHLLGLPHEGRTVVSWSMNTRYIQSREEHKTATIDERLLAAQRCVEAGYRVGFHFDPIVYYSDWEHDYEELIREVFGCFSPSSLAWVSIGALRMTSDLRKTILRRFPGSTLPTGELVPCPDGKLRYTKSIRRIMYERVFGWVRQYGSSDLGIYACMERPEVWSRIFNTAPLTDIEIGDSVTAGFQ